MRSIMPIPADPQSNLVIIAAPPVPRTEDGAIDIEAFRHLVLQAREHGCTGICLNGATAEYPLLSREERRWLIQEAVQLKPSHSFSVVAGIGSGSLRHSLELANDAEKAGADFLLLPPPFFYRYEPADLEAYFLEIACRVSRPVLLYNLPHLLTPIPAQLATKMCNDTGGILGVKDSSLDMSLLEELSLKNVKAIRLVGNDNNLYDAIEQGWLDGLISGVAGVFPDIVVPVVQALSGSNEPTKKRVWALFSGLLQKLDAFPGPIGLKLAAEFRGFGRAGVPIPLSVQRQEQSKELRQWLSTWLPLVQKELNDIRKQTALTEIPRD